MKSERPRALRFVIGTGPAARGAHIAMAMRLASHARQLGLTVRGVRQSRISGSGSCYLEVIDLHKRLWIIRISGHHRAPRAIVPNLDLVSFCGVKGETWLQDCISAILVDGLPWFDTSGTSAPPPAKTMRKIMAKRADRRFTGVAARKLPK